MLVSSGVGNVKLSHEISPSEPSHVQYMFNKGKDDAAVNSETAYIMTQLPGASDLSMVNVAKALKDIFVGCISSQRCLDLGCRLARIIWFSALIGSLRQLCTEH